MTREEAIDILVGVITTDSEEENEALDVAIKALEQKPGEDLISRQTILLDKRAEWIPISEKLPDTHDDMLVTDGENMAVGSYRDDADAWENYNFGWLENLSEPPHGIKTVIAWMPLPEPYRGRSRTMTRERAAQICQSIKFMVDKDYYSEEVEEALDVAIEVLEQETSCRNTRQVDLTQNCVKCKHYCETEDDTGVHSHCRATCSNNAQVNHWIKHSDTAYECPICGRGIDVGLPKYIDVERYCRYCGARLIP